MGSSLPLRLGHGAVAIWSVFVGSSMIAGEVGWGCRCMVVIARSASKPQFHLIELMAASHGTLAQEWRPNFVKGAPPSRSATWRLRFRTYGACTEEWGALAFSEPALPKYMYIYIYMQEVVPKLVGSFGIQAEGCKGLRLTGLGFSGCLGAL